VEYSVGWPVDARTRTAVDALAEGDWTAGLTADGKAEEKAQVVELTGLLRSSVGGDQLAGRPPDLRVIARRTRRQPGERAQVGQDAHWRYGRSPPVPPPGRSSGWTPAAGPRPTSRTR
jgi:hypothetical protein